MIISLTPTPVQRPSRCRVPLLRQKKEMICVGSIDRSIPSTFPGDGWIAKFSDRGTPLWSKRFQVPNCNFVVFRSVVEGPDDTWVGSPSYSYGFGTTQDIIQNRSGNIVLALLTDERTGPNYAITKIGYQFFQLNYQTGKKVWEKTYIYADMPVNFALLLGYTAFIKELADGRFSFHSRFSDKILSAPPYILRTVQMMTNAGGELQKVISYRTTTEAYWVGWQV
jgi:hypothetical protein